jgi:mRNA interferase RelE/StbE
VASYVLTFAKSARKELEKLPPQTVERIFSKIEALVTNPRPAGCQKLRGNNLLWRIRIGDYRVLYSIDDRAHVVDISAIGHRREIYRD